MHVAPTPFGAGGIFGGGERYPLELARALARRGDVDVDLVTFGAEVSDVVEPCGLHVRVLATRGHLRGHPAHPLAGGLRAAVAGADIVHTHHLRSAPSRLAALFARVGGRRAVVTDHGLQGGTMAGLLPRLFDRFLTVSAYSARELGLPPERTRVVLGGADPERHRPDPNVTRDGVLSVGRLTPHKGVDVLLRALPDGVPLTIAGSEGHDPSPPERDYPRLLRTLAASRDVRFAGAVSDEELAVLQRHARVFVLPSVDRTCYGRFVHVSELLSLSTIEAMASGTPVVCSRIGGLPEVVEEGVTGFLVAPGDVDALRERIELLVGDADLAARMGVAARERAATLFTWDACARRCMDAYRELVPG